MLRRHLLQRQVQGSGPTITLSSQSEEVVQIKHWSVQQELKKS